MVRRFCEACVDRANEVLGWYNMNVKAAIIAN